MNHPKGKESNKKCISVEDNQRLKDIYNDNMFSSTDRLLVIFLFATKEEMRHVCMHPEFCSADTTFSTENSKKELFTLTFKNGNNNIMNGGRAYIPNSQKWVFNIMFKE